jgi:hypothetical protein
MASCAAIPDPAGVASLVSFAHAELGGLDRVVNNVVPPPTDRYWLIWMWLPSMRSGRQPAPQWRSV